MKILYFNYHYDIEGSARGAANQVKTVSHELRKLGHNVSLVFRSAKKGSSESNDSKQENGLISFAKKSGVLRRFLNMPRVFLRNIPYFFSERKIIQKEKPDIVMSVMSYGNCSSRWAARSLGIPFVIFSEDPNAYEYETFFPQYHTYKSIGRHIEKTNLKKADSIICISEILKAYYVNYGIDPNKMTVIPNGVDQTSFKPEKRNQELESTINLKDKTIIGFVGSFNYFDNIDAIFDVFSEIIQKHPDVHYLFVGKGEASIKLRNRFETNNLDKHVTFTGAISHEKVPSYVSLMDIVLSPYLGNYLFYGSSMKVLEYMSSGKAAIATGLGQIKELITDGYNGMLFQWGNYEQLKSKILTMIEKPELRHQIGINARKTIETGWTWEIQVQKIAEVLQKVVSR